MQLVKAFIEYASYDEWLIFKADEQYEENGITKIRTHYTRYKARKRGNDVYAYTIEKKARKITRILKSLLKTETRGKIGFTNALFFVLTYQTDKPRQEAWYDNDERFNDFMYKLQQEAGKCYYIRTKESTLNGYPHNNVILVFPNRYFIVKKHKDKDGVYRWRLYSYHEKEHLTKPWVYHVDVQALESIGKAMDYSMKYITKDIETVLNSLDEKPEEIYHKALYSEDKNEREKAQSQWKALVNLAILWYLGKRIYSTSLDLILACNRIMHNYFLKINNLKWELLGIYNQDELNEFLMWITKVKDYTEIVIHDTLIFDLINLQKQKQMKKEMTRLEYLQRLNSQLEKYV
jgi:hypothetical protein